MSDFVELRVRPVTRYVVTRYNRDGETRLSSSGVMGEFQNADLANAMALCMKAQEPLARVVTSEGMIHDPVETEWIVTKLHSYENPNEVWFARDEEDAIRLRDEKEAATGTEWACFSRPKVPRSL